jgi:hypothetical protein
MTDEIEALRRLRPMLTNVIGFYDLLYEQDTNPSPVQRMMHEVWFTTSARALAVEVLKIIDRKEGEGDDRPA